MPQQDLLPRTFQANLARLYSRIIGPGISALPTRPHIHTGTVSDLNTFRDQAAGQVDNHTANEACKVFTLVLISLFERQLRLWAPRILDEGIIKNKQLFRDLLVVLANQAALDLDGAGMKDTILEAFEVGNVVRHGSGRALDWLLQNAPDLIDRRGHDYVDISMPLSPDSEWVRIRPHHVLRYASTLIRFWGLVDREPGAESNLSVIEAWLTWSILEGSE